MTRKDALRFGPLVLFAALGGCGGKDKPVVDAGTDTGSAEGGGMDATGAEGGTEAGLDAGGDARRDAGPPRLRECDPWTEGSCGAEEKCSVVIDVLGPEDAEVLFACVPRRLGVKEEGVACARFGRDATPTTMGDDARTDDCAQGLFCWRAPDRPTISVCQRLCGAEGIDCMSDEWCAILNSEPRFGTCRRAEGCDVVFQTGCREGSGCYVVPSTQGDLLGVCLEFSPPDGGTGAVGEPCMFLDSCRPGTQCLNEILPDGGLGGEARCRELCRAAGGSADGGTDEDGGTAGLDAGPAPDAGVSGDAGSVSDAGTMRTGRCPEPQQCRAIPVASGRTARVPTPPGACM
ncbi:MAG: hypothetical protein NZ898_08545 [Myxococcota bacterium]|nr:hypothetical protein [Myxococcota bacterium]MDW8363996.1 hypothetical protein [Myxococcales bacterium]